MIDSHIHFDDPRFDHDRNAVYQRATEVGVKAMIVPGITANTWKRTRSICKKFPQTFPAYGLHPYFTAEHTDQDLIELENWVKKEKPIAIGECGLDYFISDLDPEKQKIIFSKQLAIAKTFNLPVIVHARKAVEEVILLVKKSGCRKGMVHSFNGSLQQAERLINLGFYLSFGGAATYSKAKHLQRVIEGINVEKILIETDAPDQPDHVHYGQRNEPSYLPYIIERVSEIKKISFQDVARITSNNVIKLFDLKIP